MHLIDLLKPLGSISILIDRLEIIHLNYREKYTAVFISSAIFSSKNNNIGVRAVDTYHNIAQNTQFTAIPF
jgi:hypothetical protein